MNPSIRLIWIRIYTKLTWIPSLNTTSGMDASKLRIVPIAVNTTLFDPATTKPLKLPMGDMVFGRNRHFGLPEPMVSAHGGQDLWP